MTETRDIGAPVQGWQEPPCPPRAEMMGRYVRLEPLSRTHAAEIHAAFEGADGAWDWMPYGPFATEDAYGDWIDSVSGGNDPLFFALRDLASGKALGAASYLRIAPSAGSIELGHIALSPALQQSRAATEAWFLMMDWAFSNGYRRFEWKCNALNLPSRRAAQRLGLSFEGIFRQAAVIKGHNRDTAWFAAIDGEWPALRAAFQSWLDPANFAPDGQQRESLSRLTHSLLVSTDPQLGP